MPETGMASTSALVISSRLMQQGDQIKAGHSASRFSGI